MVENGSDKDRCDGVSAGAAVAEGVSVDFVEDVAGAVFVAEAGGVDGTALGGWAGEGGGACCVGSCY